MTSLLLGLIFTRPLHANDTYGTVTGVQLNTCYDGDTCRFNIPSWPPIIGEDISVRIAGLDTPEIRGECQEEKEQARKAKHVTHDLLNEADTITLRNIRRGKYFRLVAEVYADTQSVTQLLLDRGIARPYAGGTRKGWCDTSDTTPNASESAT